MTDDRHSKRLPGLQGIGVPEEVAEEVALPDDRDADAVGDYYVPDVARRRQAGYVYLGGGIVVAIGVALGLPTGMWLMVGLLLAGLLAMALGLRAAWRTVEQGGTETTVFDPWWARPSVSVGFGGDLL